MVNLSAGRVQAEDKRVKSRICETTIKLEEKKLMVGEGRWEHFCCLGTCDGSQIYFSSRGRKSYSGSLGELGDSSEVLAFEKFCYHEDQQNSQVLTDPRFQSHFSLSMFCHLLFSLVDSL